MSAPCGACGGVVSELVTPGLPDAPTGALALRNLLGAAPTDWYRWRVTECAGCGHLDCFREPLAAAEARVRAAEHRRRELLAELNRS